MQNTMGSKRREVGVRLSHRSIGDGRKDNIPDGPGGEEDSSVAVFVVVFLLPLLFDADPSCKCSGEFGGSCSSSDAFPARSTFD